VLQLNKPAVDIVLPCYNPQSNWHEELISFYQSLADEYKLTFIIVNDGSVNDNVNKSITQLRETQLPVELITLPMNMGKGFALRSGVARAASDFILYTDIDFPFTNESMRRFIGELVSGGHNIVAGFREENYYEHRISFFRKQLSKTFRFFLKRGLRLPVTDTQCGLKGFDKSGREKFLATTINRYLFDFEFIYNSVKDPAISIKAVPVELKQNVVFTSMRMRIMLQESFNLLAVLLKRKRRRASGGNY
jgi:glycosyltransferase involved in cell wall biosynthesis